MKFINECGCKFEHEILENAIDLECQNRNKYCYDEYKIYRTMITLVYVLDMNT